MDFFAYMEDAIIVPPGEESLVGDFAAFLLKMMRYDEGRHVIHLRKEMRFEMCGQRVDAKRYVCVMERSGTGAKYLLLVQEDRSVNFTFACRRFAYLFHVLSATCPGTTLDHRLLPRR